MKGSQDKRKQIAQRSYILCFAKRERVRSIGRPSLICLLPLLCGAGPRLTGFAFCCHPRSCGRGSRLGSRIIRVASTLRALHPWWSWFVWHPVRPGRRSRDGWRRSQGDARRSTIGVIRL